MTEGNRKHHIWGARGGGKKNEPHETQGRISMPVPPSVRGPSPTRALFGNGGKVMDASVMDASCRNQRKHELLLPGKTIK